MKRFSAIVLLMGAAVASLLQACSKTEYEYEKRPYKNIETFVLMGYTGDSINATINEGNIIIYWAAETAAPKTIKPNIVVSDHATISPASGTEVAFSSETVYTVTAEDGSKQTFRLKPVINHAVPRISGVSPNNLHFFHDTTVTVSGEYFLTGDTSDVHVYAQRMRDGFEFDLNIDYSKISMTSITANLPAYSDILDTGLHKIFVKIGDRVSDEKIVTLRIPDISYTGLMHLSFDEVGKQLVAGDSLTLRLSDDYNGDVIKWYAKRFTKLVIEDYTFEAAQMTQTENTIKFKLPDAPISTKPNSLLLYFVSPYYSPTYWGVLINQNAWPIIPVKN